MCTIMFMYMKEIFKGVAVRSTIQGFCLNIEDVEKAGSMVNIVL